MRIPRIYTDQPLSSGTLITLEESPSRHIAKVLRMQPGRELVLFNGRGGEYQACIEAVNKKSVSVTVGGFDQTDRQSPLNIELAIGLSRGERFDWVLQKATELGITRIAPLITERTEVKLSGERLEKKMHHWQQILVSACEQCQRNRLPQLSKPVKLADWLATSEAALQFVLHHRSDRALSELPRPDSLALLVGPEGGLSDAEIQLAQAQGHTPLALGPRVLRTETAPVVALSLFQHLWGDL